LQRSVLYLVLDVAFWTGEFGFVFSFEEDDEIEVVPHVVLVLYVFVERYRLVVETFSFQTAYEAGVLEDVVLALLLGPQIGERVDDHSEDQVEDDDDEDEEEEEVVDESQEEARSFSVAGFAEDVSDSPSVPESLVQRGYDAHEERLAVVLLHLLHPLRASSHLFHDLRCFLGLIAVFIIVTILK